MLTRGWQQESRRLNVRLERNVEHPRPGRDLDDLLNTLRAQDLMQTSQQAHRVITAMDFRREPFDAKSTPYGPFQPEPTPYPTLSANALAQSEIQSMLHQSQVTDPRNRMTAAKSTGQTLETETQSSHNESPPHPETELVSYPSQAATGITAMNSTTIFDSLVLSQGSLQSEQQRPKETLAARPQKQKKQKKQKKVHVCSHCDKQFDKRSIFTRHEATHIPSGQRKTFDCAELGCGKRYLTRAGLDRHKVSHIPDDQKIWLHV